MIYRILVEHVEGGFVATVFDEDSSEVASGVSASRKQAIERAKHKARNSIDDSSPVFVIEELSSSSEE